MPRLLATQVLGPTAVFERVPSRSLPPTAAEKARLERSAQAVARLRHPNLVRLLPLPGGAGVAPVLGNARRLADFTLPAGTFKRFDLEQVLRLLLDVLSGLAALHEVVTDGKPFVHGQVSPHNIYIDEHGTARLVPLLNAHSSSRSAVKLEDAGYAAPEQLAGRALDVRADVFSVGVMLWEALAGKRLFPDSSAEGLRARSWGLKAAPIRLSPEARWAQPLCALAERAIATDPRARFASALELSSALAAAAARQLSRVDVDAWQEEAPTPVFQPRLHLATLRSSTPEPAVLTITAPEPAPAVKGGSSATAAEEPAIKRRRGPRWARRVLGSVAVLALGVAGVALARAPIDWHRAAAAVKMPPLFPPVAARVAAAPHAAPALAPALAPVHGAPPVAAPIVSAAPSASTVENSLGAPVSAPSSSRRLRPAQPRLTAPPAPKPKANATRDGSNDYGI